MKNRLIIFTSMMIAYASIAGDRIGNGGDAIFVNGELHLLDLYEQGVYSKASLNDIFQRDVVLKALNASESKWLRKVFPSDFPTLEMTLVLAQVRRVDAVLCDMIVAAIRSHKWSFLDTELNNSKDENSFVEIQNNPLIQLALRDWLHVRIHKPSFDRLENFEKAFLILHEAIYILSDTSSLLNEDSRAIREVVSAFASISDVREIRNRVVAIGSQWLPLALNLGSQEARHSYVELIDGGCRVNGAFFVEVDKKLMRQMSEPGPNGGPQDLTAEIDYICDHTRNVPLSIYSYAYESTVKMVGGVPKFFWRVVKVDLASVGLETSVNTLFQRRSNCERMAKESLQNLMLKAFRYLKSVDVDIQNL